MADTITFKILTFPPDSPCIIIGLDALFPYWSGGRWHTSWTARPLAAVICVSNVPLYMVQWSIMLATSGRNGSVGIVTRLKAA